MTTPTPPDAVREARIREALVNALDEVSLEGMNHLAIALGHEGHSRFASWGFFVSSLTDALLARPSDARGREAVNLVREIGDGTVRAVFHVAENPERKRFEVQRFGDSGLGTFYGASPLDAFRAALSPTQEGA